MNEKVRERKRESRAFSNVCSKFNPSFQIGVGDFNFSYPVK